MLWLTGCSFQSSSVEQRVVELPAGDPNSTLGRAAQIGQDLLAGGLAADLAKQFPDLKPEQFRGVFLTWNVGNFQGTRRVFFLTGIRYTGTFPEAKAVADYCEARVKRALAEKLPDAAPTDSNEKSPATSPNPSANRSSP